MIRKLKFSGDQMQRFKFLLVVPEADGQKIRQQRENKFALNLR